MTYKVRWICAGVTFAVVLAALGAGLWFGGGPANRDGWEAASWAAGVTGAFGLVVNALVWATAKPSRTSVSTASPPIKAPQVPDDNDVRPESTTYTGNHFDFRGAQAQTIIGQQNNQPRAEPNHRQGPNK